MPYGIQTRLSTCYRKLNIRWRTWHCAETEVLSFTLHSAGVSCIVWRCVVAFDDCLSVIIYSLLENTKSNSIPIISRESVFLFSTNMPAVMAYHDPSLSIRSSPAYPTLIQPEAFPPLAKLSIKEGRHRLTSGSPPPIQTARLIERQELPCPPLHWIELQGRDTNPCLILALQCQGQTVSTRTEKEFFDREQSTTGLYPGSAKTL